MYVCVCFPLSSIEAITPLFPFIHRASKPQLRSQSTSVPMDCTIIEIDDKDKENEVEEEEEEEGPHSWPGTLQAHPPSESFLKSTTPNIAPFRAPTLTTPPPLMYRPSFPIPTLFTLVPPGLFGSSTPLINPLVTTQSQPLSIPQSVITSTSSTTSSAITKPTSTSIVTSPSALSPFQKCPVTLASIPPEEMTPAHHELKAFAEEFKTKRIQLGYTQGAVGQSLADRGYNNFAQSTISRFEQMQLSPSNAATIMVVLKRWLHEAENPDAVSSTSTDPMCPPRKRKKRVVYTPQALAILNSYFQKESRPNRQIIEMIAQELDLLPEEVRVWFCNKRQKCKPEETDSSSFAATSPQPTSPGSTVGHRNTPSPPRTRFTVEELSKSSTSTFTPLCFTSHLTVSPPTFRPMIFAHRQPTMTGNSLTSFTSTKA